ncbi:MAG: T9SS type A sorting domain-containing protein [Leptospiraceae bacterium]|nr:T9SS type A sorting domain-containing protein [Leptospiraceae bacterium]
MTSQLPASGTNWGISAGTANLSIQSDTKYNSVLNIQCTSCPGTRLVVDTNFPDQYDDRNMQLQIPLLLDSNTVVEFFARGITSEGSPTLYQVVLQNGTIRVNSVLTSFTYSFNSWFLLEIQGQLETNNTNCANYACTTVYINRQSIGQFNAVSSFQSIGPNTTNGNGFVTYGEIRIDSGNIKVGSVTAKRSTTAFPDPSSNGETTPVLAPNKFVASKHNGVQFFNLTGNASVKIYDLSGELKYQKSNVVPGEIWDVKGNSGQNLSSGIYFVVIQTSSGETHRLKLAVIR